jgi:hypothetical protein
MTDQDSVEGIEQSVERCLRHSETINRHVYLDAPLLAGTNLA